MDTKRGYIGVSVLRVYLRVVALATAMAAGCMRRIWESSAIVTCVSLGALGRKSGERLCPFVVTGLHSTAKSLVRVAYCQHFAQSKARKNIRIVLIG